MMCSRLQPRNLSISHLAVSFSQINHDQGTGPHLPEPLTRDRGTALVVVQVHTGGKTVLRTHSVSQVPPLEEELGNLLVPNQHSMPSVPVQVVRVAF